MKYSGAIHQPQFISNNHNRDRASSCVDMKSDRQTGGAEVTKEMQTPIALKRKQHTIEHHDQLCAKQPV